MKISTEAFVDELLDRKPIDPPPIVQLKISASVDPPQTFLQSKDNMTLSEDMSLLTHIFCRSLLFYLSEFGG